MDTKATMRLDLMVFLLSAEELPCVSAQRSRLTRSGRYTYFNESDTQAVRRLSYLNVAPVVESSPVAREIR